MNTSNAQKPISTLFDRLAKELADALAAMRLAESEVQFELAAADLSRVAEELEWLGVAWGA